MLDVSIAAFGYTSLQTRGDEARMVDVAGAQVRGTLGDIFD
jgi:hypothetical protein